MKLRFYYFRREIIMRLKEFIKTDIYKESDCIEYVGTDGMEIDMDEEKLTDYTVLGYHKSSGGYLEIRLNAI